MSFTESLRKFIKRKMKVVLIEKAPKFKNIETGQTIRYDLDKNDDFDAFCLDLISIGSMRDQKFFKIITDTKHELNFSQEKENG